MKMELTTDRWQQLRSVNYRANRDIEYVTDQDLYKTPEYWEYPKGKGDCEDIALAKNKMLRDLGWPKETLDIAICKVDGAGHAVLIAHTSGGDYVLDNRFDEPRPWQSEDVMWLGVTVGGDFKNWHEIGASNGEEAA